MRVSNPSGNVSLKFSSRQKMSAHDDDADDAAADAEAAGAENVVTLNHSGKLMEIADDEFQKKVQSKRKITSGFSQISQSDYQHFESGTFNNFDRDLVGRHQISFPDADYYLRLPANLVHHLRLPPDILKEHFIVKAGLGPVCKIRGLRSMPDSTYIGILRPVIAQHNPNCIITSKGSRILSKTRIVKAYFACSRLVFNL